MVKPTGIFKQINEHTYSNNECFLCGCSLTDTNRTVEHVFPKWLQRKFNLWDLKISLLNETLYSYRNLTIPSCYDCNNKYLNPFELEVSNAFERGFEGITELSKDTLFYWLGKIYFGLMYKELSLNFDQKNPKSGKIVTPEYIKFFNSHYLFLQGIRGKHSFINFFPASIFIFKTQMPNDIQYQWDFIDDHQTLFISIRMGEVGLIANLQDCGLTKREEEYLDVYKKFDLHPVQFRELTAKIMYKGHLFNRTPRFISAQNDETFVETHLSPLYGYNSKPVFDEWDFDEYMKLLSGLIPITSPIEQGKIFSCLIDKNGSPIFIDVNKDLEI